MGALASLIIPSGSTAGAREAGAIYFIDKALATFDRDKREAYRQGFRMVEARREELFPGSMSIVSLKPGDKLRLAQAIENSDTARSFTHSAIPVVFIDCRTCKAVHYLNGTGCVGRESD